MSNRPLTDVWLRPIVTVDDGHSAYSCNDYACTIHPDYLYGRPDDACTLMQAPMPAHECGSCRTKGAVERGTVQ